jgi:hypothetical protein
MLSPSAGSPPMPEAVVFARLPTNFQPVQVSDSELTAALEGLWLNEPLQVSTPCPPLYVGRKLALALEPSSDKAGQSALVRDYGRYCERRRTPGDCLTLFADGPRLQDDDKRSIALALAVGPALENVSAEVRAMLNPTRVLATLSITITAYMALLLAPIPEPVTKGMATAFTLLMWGYLGWEFFDLLRAYAQLYEDAPRASTFAELREIGERFAKVLGPNIKSFRAFKRHMGKAGPGKEWHHIVEKRNAKRFGAEAVHNTENVIPLEKPLHERLSALYSSIQENITRSTALTVRQWLDTQSYEAQRAFGLLAIENVRKGVW